VSRNLILFAGTIAWVGVGVDTVFHIAIGDPVVPALFGIVIAGWLAIRAPQLVLRWRAERELVTN
jgi:hypothetical protein